MNLSLAESFAHCKGVTRTRARNFYYAFVLLPRPERDAICSIYAFMRRCDDLSDDPGPDAAPLLGRWRQELDAALAGAPAADPLWPAFVHTVRRYNIPHTYFHDMIDGVTSDLSHAGFAAFDDLYRYCYRVASVAGLSLIRILGCHSLEALVLAEKCGVAFQLTNILRDVREDAARGRIYFPAEDLDRFGVERADLFEGRSTPAFLELMRFEAARAAAFYAQAAPLVGMVAPRGRPALRTLIHIYSRLLQRIERSGFDVFRKRIRLPAWEKIWLLLKSGLS